jgi:hypothetical protein
MRWASWTRPRPSSSYLRKVLLIQPGDQRGKAVMPSATLVSQSLQKVRLASIFLCSQIIRPSVAWGVVVERMHGAAWAAWLITLKTTRVPRTELMSMLVSQVNGDHPRSDSFPIDCSIAILGDRALTARLQFLEIGPENRNPAVRGFSKNTFSLEDFWQHDALPLCFRHIGSSWNKHRLTLLLPTRCVEVSSWRILTPSSGVQFQRGQSYREIRAQS